MLGLLVADSTQSILSMLISIITSIALIIRTGLGRSRTHRGGKGGSGTPGRLCVVAEHDHCSPAAGSMILVHRCPGYQKTGYWNHLMLTSEVHAIAT